MVGNGSNALLVGLLMLFFDNCFTDNPQEHPPNTLPNSSGRVNKPISPIVTLGSNLSNMQFSKISTNNLVSVGDFSPFANSPNPAVNLG